MMPNEPDFIPSDLGFIEEKDRDHIEKMERYVKYLYERQEDAESNCRWERVLSCEVEIEEIGHKIATVKRRAARRRLRDYKKVNQPMPCKTNRT